MSELKLSTDQEAQLLGIIKSKKPYLIAIDEKVTSLEFGSILVEVMVRNGSVDKMDFKEVNKSWLRDKSA